MIGGIFHFSEEDAQKYGVHEAVILYNLRFWVRKNMENNKHFYDGYFWTYNSIAAFRKQFSFFTEKQIRTALENLRKVGAILSGNYNQTPYDRTLWYTVPSEHLNFEHDQSTERANGEDQKGKSKGPERPIEKEEKANQEDQKGRPIPDINPDIKPNKKSYMGKKQKGGPPPGGGASPSKAKFNRNIASNIAQDRTINKHSVGLKEIMGSLFAQFGMGSEYQPMGACRS